MSSKDVNIEQYKSELDENTEYYNEMINLMDWQHLFFNPMHKIPEFQSFIKIKMEELENILDKSEWQERISKRGLGFLAIITKMESIIERKLYLSKNILWNDIPGIKIILESINYELEKNPVSHYSEALIKLLRIFINEPQIINRLFKIIISKTK